MYIYGLVYVRNSYGDLDWMIRKKKYHNSLFLFIDNESLHCTSKGSLRPFNIFGFLDKNLNKPLSHGIPIGKYSDNYYNSWEDIQKSIHLSFLELRTMLKTYSYNEIYFNASESDGLLEGNFSREIAQKITQEIFNLGTTPFAVQNVV